MKRLLILAATFAALSLLAPQVGQAQGFQNQLGIYSDPAGTPASANYFSTPNVPFNAYLVLTNPVNNTFNGGIDTAQPITEIGAFECRVNMPSDAGFISSVATYPSAGVNLETPPYYVVGYPAGLPVTGTSVVLCSWSFMVLDNNEYNITLGLAHFPSLPGQMAIVDNNDPLDDLVPTFVSTNSFANPVFAITGAIVTAVDDASFGSVKALFR